MATDYILQGTKGPEAEAPDLLWVCSLYFAPCKSYYDPDMPLNLGVPPPVRAYLENQLNGEEMSIRTFSGVRL